MDTDKDLNPRWLIIAIIILFGAVIWGVITFYL